MVYIIVRVFSFCAFVISSGGDIVTRDIFVVF